ncbi:8029_t:CDS:2 [Funneliformis geosporum]|uniref:8029_t:CDS:1 n=1 Tax=Funneliformis geosporum TaxID=1117311 RepID=A0A9W4WU29_9GLOM|nr:8029_t:CDS:2 [Funneliformis geosporum]
MPRPKIIRTPKEIKTSQKNKREYFKKYLKEYRLKKKTKDKDYGHKTKASETNETKNEVKGFVVAELVERHNKKSKKGETYYILEISVRRNITEMVLELKNQTNSVSVNANDPLYVFTNEGKNRKLSNDRKSVERTLRLVLDRKDAENEEEIITNQELLSDLKRRIKEGKITFEMSAVNSDSNSPLEIDTDLKDNEKKIEEAFKNKELVTRKTKDGKYLLLINVITREYILTDLELVPKIDFDATELKKNSVR